MDKTKTKTVPSTGKRRRDAADESDNESESDDDSDDDNPDSDDEVVDENPAPAQDSSAREVPQRNKKPLCSRVVCSKLRLNVTQDDTILMLLFIEKPIFNKRFSKLLIDNYMSTVEFEECLGAGHVSVSSWTV